MLATREGYIARCAHGRRRAGPQFSRNPTRWRPIGSRRLEAGGLVTKKQLRRGPVRLRPCIIEWDDQNWSHFEEHGRCTKTQVEEVLASTCHDSLRDLQRGETYIYFGISCAGRALAVVARVRRFAPDAVRTSPKAPIVERARPITCWALGGTNLARYHAWRTTNKVRR
jgi:hypothetical protein